MNRLEILEKEYADLKKHKSTISRLSLEDSEDCSDNFQDHLEIGYELDGLYAEIQMIKKLEENKQYGQCELKEFAGAVIEYDNVKWTFNGNVGGKYPYQYVC